MGKVDKKIFIDLSGLDEPDYTGSVQELYFSKQNPEWMICKTMPGGSVFDVGTIFSIPGSDICRTALRHKIYSSLGAPGQWDRVQKIIGEKCKDNQEMLWFLNEGLLEDFRANGANTHHVGMIDKDTGEVHRETFPRNPSPYVLVKRYRIIKPGRVSCFSKYLWDYSDYRAADKFVIPLENIVRFGVTSGSSIYKKYLSLDGRGRRDFLGELGLEQELVPWTFFAKPLVDFTTKYEPEDRSLSLQEALYISGVNGASFLNIIKMCLLGSIMVAEIFREMGLLLWDLKWEIARDGDKLVFVDTIDTDSVRVTARVAYKDRVYFVNFNKQAMRDYYMIMSPRWCEAVKSAKAEAVDSGRSFHHYLKAGQGKGSYPKTPVVDEEFIRIQEQKFSALIDYIYGRSTAGEITEKYKLIGREEIRYYDAKGVLDEFGKLNGA